MSNSKFVAEVSSNHNRNINRAKKFIKIASEVGCSGIKFQLFKIDKLFAPEILSKSEEHRSRSKWELPIEFLPELSKYSSDCGLEFSCTPFYLEAVEELLPYVDFFKIASYELLWDALLIACAKTKKPVVLSTGMATMDEIENAVKILKENGCDDLTLLHCVSGYPTPVSECNLSAIKTIKDAFNCKVGWSDHSVNPGVIIRAINRWNAEMVEFHLDLDGKGDEYKGGHCWLPEEIESVIGSVNSGFEADGTGIKQPAKSEIADRDWRTDPTDGLRPLKHIRDTFNE